MIIHHLPTFLRLVLLVVLFAPLVFAGLVALARNHYRVARRMAGLFAALHIGLTAVVVAPCAIARDTMGTYTAADVRFHPVMVPGDTATRFEWDTEQQEHKTSWNLFFVGQAKPNCPPPAVQFFLGVDGLNIWMLALTSVMTYVAVLVSWRFAQDRAGWYYAWIFVLQFAVTGAFLSFDVILFYVFFELTLIPAFFLIGGWGVGGGKRDAARKFFLYTLFGSLFSLIGLIGIVYTNPSPPGRWMNSAKPAQLPRGSVTFNINELMMNVGKWSWEYDRAVSEATTKNEEAAVTAERTKTPKDVDRQAQAEREMVQAISTRQAYHSAQFWLFFCLIAGFVVKIPLVPFHTWLPSAYCEAPPAVTLLLSAVMAKLGTLGLMRIVIPLCPEMSVQYGLPVLGTLAAIGIVYAAACAFAQKDVKRMAAYSSISHLGLLVLGLFALNQEGMTGAALHMLNHGLTAGAMFALLAFLHDRFQTTDTTQYGGLLAQYPRFAFFMMVICLAAVGLPGLNNFVSEMMLISALFTPWNTTISGYGLAVAAAAGIFLSAWYTFTMVRVVFFGPTRTPPVPKDETAPDLTGREMVAYGLPALLCLVLGILPQVMIDTVKADIAVLHSHVTQARMRLHPKLLQEENQLPAWSTVNEDTRSLRLDGPPPGGPGNLPLPEGNPPRPPGP